MTIQEMPQLFNSRKAGEFLGLSSPRQHVNELLKRGRFPEPYMIIDNRRYWTEQQLIEYKAKKESEGK